MDTYKESKKLKVLVIGSLPPPYGGTAVTLAYLIDSLRKNEDVEIVGINTTGIRNNGFCGAIRFLKAMLMVLLAAFRVDVVTVHISSTAMPIWGSWIWLCCMVAGRPFIIRKYGGGDYRKLGRIKGWIANQVVIHANLYLAETKELVRHARENNITHVKWFPTARPMFKTPDDMPKRNGLCRRYVYIGHVREYKGLRELVAATEKCNVNITVDVYGPWFDDLPKDLFDYCPRINYHGVLEPQHVVNTMIKYDAFVLPTKAETEGHPGVVLESYIAGLPIIATNCGAISEIVNEKTGILVPPGDVESLYLAMNRLADDDELYRKLRSGVKGEAAQFDSDLWATRFVCFCREIVEKTTKQKTRVLFVGGFKKSAGGGVAGGQVFASLGLIESPLSEHIDWVLLDCTQESLVIRMLARRVLSAIFRLLCFIWLLIIKRPKCVLIFTGAGLSFYEKGLMTILARVLRKRVLLCPRSGLLMNYYAYKRFSRYYVSFVLKCSSFVVCQGEQWRAFFQQITDLPDDRLVIIGNWLDTRRYIEIADLHRRAPVTVLFLGRIERNKGILDLIIAAHRFRDRLNEVRFLICGDGLELEKIKKLLCDLKMLTRFELRGWVNGEEKFRALTEADILVLPSYQEGFPNVLLEAMAAGRAVLASSVGGIPDLVKEEETGLLCQPGQIDEIGSKLVRLCNEDGLRERLGKAGRKQVMEHHDIEKVCLKWRELLVTNIHFGRNGHKNETLFFP